MDVFDLFKEADSPSTKKNASASRSVLSASAEGEESQDRVDDSPSQSPSTDSPLPSDSEDFASQTRSLGDDEGMHLTASEPSFNGLLGQNASENGPEQGFNALSDVNPPLEGVVVSIPGSLVFRKGQFHLSWLTSLAKRLEALHAQGRRVAVVVGESPHARIVGKTARQLGLPVNEIEAHIASSSFLNAALVLRLLSKAHPQVCEELTDAMNAMQQNVIPIVMGGKESVTVEARAASLAEKTNSKCIILTENEIPTNTLTHARFAKLANEAAKEGDNTFIVDALTPLILARGKVETILLWGKNISQLDAALSGNDFDGTRIVEKMVVARTKKIWKE